MSPEARLLGKGSQAHKLVQAQVAAYFQRQGCITLIEGAIGRHKCVDVLVHEIALKHTFVVEIHMNEAWWALMHQLVQNRARGMSDQLVVVPPKRLAAAQAYIEARLPSDYLAGIRFCSTGDFVFPKDSPEAVSIPRNNWNKTGETKRRTLP